MIDEMQDTIDAQKEQLSQKDEQLNQKDEQLSQKDEQLNQQKEQIRQFIRTFILDNLDEGVPKERILLKLQKRFDLTVEKAYAYFAEVAET